MLRILVSLEEIHCRRKKIERNALRTIDINRLPLEITYYLRRGLHWELPTIKIKDSDRVKCKCQGRVRWKSNGN